MNITVCCCTFRRPALLGYMIRCFERQTHKARRLVILDDSGELQPQERNRWKIVTTAERFPTLAAKRNACAALADPRTEALVVWDDDDLFFTWALNATANALRLAPWSRPSQYCLWNRQKNELTRHLTYARPDRRDKACQCAWGVRRELFDAVGGYPEELSVGEDKQLALRLEAAGAEECDPIERFGYQPWYVWGPWGNQHVSSPRVDYGTFDGGQRQPVGARVEPTHPPGMVLTGPAQFTRRVQPRPWQGDWYTDPERP
jgi:hypothetical protein